MQQKIGMITVGQSPRDDIVPAMSRILGPGIEILQKGALDGGGGQGEDSFPGPGQDR